MASFRSQAPCKCCWGLARLWPHRFSNFANDSRPSGFLLLFFFFVAGRNVVGLSSQSAMSTAPKWQPKGWATRRHLNWFSWYRITPVSGINGCPIISIETKPERGYLDIARHMGNGITGGFLCFAALVWFCVWKRHALLALSSIFVQTIVWPHWIFSLSSPPQSIQMQDCKRNNRVLNLSAPRSETRPSRVWASFRFWFVSHKISQDLCH